MFSFLLLRFVDLSFNRVRQVGTSLGATQGLLLRGGSVLEKFSMVNTIVFDKTGTLTIGKPVVTKVVTVDGVGNTDLQLSDDRCLSWDYPYIIFNFLSMMLKFTDIYIMNACFRVSD